MSQPDEQLNNEEKYMEIMRKLDPEMHLIKIALEETGVNPAIVLRFIRSLANLNVGTGYGVVEVLVKARSVTQIKTNESDVVDMAIDRANNLP